MTKRRKETTCILKQIIKKKTFRKGKKKQQHQQQKHIYTCTTHTCIVCNGLKLTYSKKNARISHSGLDVGDVVISEQNTKLIRS